MDRNHVRSRATDLRDVAKLFADLARMPDRATAEDFSRAAGLMTNAASDLDTLINATPIGCVCARIETDNHNYLDYVESCQHHGQFYRLRESLRADYERMEKSLKHDTRLRLITAALTGAAAWPEDGHYASRAIHMADITLRLIGAESK